MKLKGDVGNSAAEVEKRTPFYRLVETRVGGGSFVEISVEQQRMRASVCLQSARYQIEKSD